MDLNDELCRGDIFYDFVMPKTEPDPNVLTPVAYIDSTEMGDPNNNCLTTDHIKTYLDDMIFIEDSPLSISSSSLMNGSESISGPFEPITAEEMNRASASLGLQGPYQWSHAVSTNETTSTHSSPDTNWLSTPEAQVPNLLDPVYTYDQEPPGTDTKLQYYSSETDGVGVNNNVMVSSDLISSTYSSNGDHSTSVLGLDSDLSTPLAWHKQDSPDSQFIFCDAPSADSSMLLRTALQGGNKGHLEPQSNPNSTNKACDNMIELRRVLSYPPMSTTTTGSPSPTSTSTSSPGSGGEIHYYQVHQQNNQAHYCEFKVIDPMFSNSSVMSVDDANIPNVEELIMARIEFNEDPGTATFYNGNQTQRKKLEMVSERKVNSTTLSTKWTYATPNSNGQPKPAKRRKKQQPSTEPAHSTPSSTLSQGDISESSVTTNSSSSGGSDMSGSPNSSNGGATSRKERSLHYCNICNKGFKDKYSVNVHIRTHSGEKPFACSLCGKNFRQKAHLAKHYQTHAAKANGQTGKGSMKRTMTAI